MSNLSVDIIDSHLHLFNLADGHYRWLKPLHPPFWPDKNQLNRNYHESDLTLNPPLVLKGFVHIEGGFDNRQPWRELDWLASHCTLPFRSVANISLTSADCPSQIEQLLLRPSLTGVRHILDEQCAIILNHPLVKPHMRTLARHNLSFDAQLTLTDPEGVRALATILEDVPELTVIIEHGGWPPNTAEQLAWQSWCDNLRLLAEFPNVAIKLSGWEMPNRGYILADIHPVLHQCLAYFGAKRVMLASNFPLCTWTRTYHQLWQLYSDELGLDALLRQQLVYKNAAHWYRF